MRELRTRVTIFANATLSFQRFGVTGDMKGRPFNVLVSFSLLLFAATLFLWILSYAAPQMATAERFHRYSIISNRGCLSFVNCSLVTVWGSENPITTGPYAYADRWYLFWGFDWEQFQTSNFSKDFWQTPPAVDPEEKRFLGIRYLEFGKGYRFIDDAAMEFGYQFILPYWIVAVSFLLLPAIWILRKWLSRVRDLQGMCRRCGYDLRATPNRCPECGTARE